MPTFFAIANFSPPLAAGAQRGPELFNAWSWIALVVLLTAGIALLLWRWWAGLDGPAKASPLGRMMSDEGTATIEFALVFPVLLVMILVLIQTTFAFTGTLFVNYAAFAAARRAIVEVPRDLVLEEVGDEAQNVVFADGSQKRENIRGVAAFALMPVSGPGEVTGLTAGRPVGTAVDELYVAETIRTPRWSETLVDRRLVYALEHTDVELRALTNAGVNSGDADFDRPTPVGREFEKFVSPDPTAGDGARYRYGPRDPIQVVVSHRFHLSVPFAGRLFRSGTHTVDGTTTPYREIVSSFALTNEGVWRDLPEQPAVERRDWDPS